MDSATYPVPSWSGVTPHVSTLEAYKEDYARSINDPNAYWDSVAENSVTWFRKYDSVLEGSFQDGDVRWFEGGQLNMSYNCIDRHLKDRGDKVAYIWERDEPGCSVTYTYKQVFHEVCRLSNALSASGVQRGDRVAIYMPMTPHAAFCMLACARIGAVHSVVFAGFSAEALRARITDAQCKVVLTANAGIRGGRVIHLKATVDRALRGCDSVRRVLVYEHPSHKDYKVDMVEGRDIWMQEAMAGQKPYCPPQHMDSEDPLFMLYTSGSTGKPKGLIHSTAGYCVYTMHTTKLVWDLHEDDVYACVADVGWITGHTYVTYGPLLNGATCVIFESLPTFPDAGRYWRMVQELKVTQLYTAPTAIRTLMAYGDEPVKKWDRSTLRILGSVGEPINPEAWRWYYEVVGEKRCAVVDSWFQTETGAISITPLPGATPTKPGSATFPFYGQNPVIFDVDTGTVVDDGKPGKGLLLLGQPWPGLARTIYGDHARYMETYLSAYPGYYLTGDGCERDEDGYIWITGRVDDVINKAGHRLGTAEIESALVLHDSCAEAAVVAVPHDVKGQAIVAFVILTHGWSNGNSHDDLVGELKLQVRKEIGGIAVPDWLILVTGLPKTRSGKIMRRVLRKVACNESDQLGDISTMADPDVVTELISLCKEKMGHLDK